jgi:carboxypeptidase T
MKYLFSTLIALFVCTSLSAQSSDYKRIEVEISSKEDILTLGALGIAIDHAYLNEAKNIVHDFHSSDIAKIEAAGFEYTVLENELSSFYAHQCSHDHSHHTPLINEDCFSDDIDITSPENFHLGSMGGYLTYEEALAELDQMFELYPNLISEKTVINDQLTHEGRPIHWVRISDNPNTDEDEPEVMYNALTHAREPMGLMQMVFYMWYLLENYETDDEVKFLVDHTEMYFIPVVNPDGYVHNQTIEPDGGGLWRKNRRLNDDGTYGVDLNRNFAYGWGIDDNGSSPVPESQVYRGPSPASEPEIQMLQHFCVNRSFAFALNYHCYGNLLIMPWGFSSTPTDEGETFTLFAEALTKVNNYFAGTAVETVGYTANGVADDWMYGEVDEKEAIYSMTPEVGPNTFGFWPPASSIDNLSKTVLRQNLNLAHLPHNFGIVELYFDDAITGTNGSIEFDLKKYGLLDGDFDLTLTSSTPGLDIMDATQTLSPGFGELVQGEYSFEIGASVPSGILLEFELLIDNGQFINKIPFEIFYNGANQIEEEIIFDGNTALGVWDQQDTWGLSTLEYYTAPFSIGDSPFSNYESNASSMLISNPITIEENTISVFLRFYAKWIIEEGFDYVQIQAADADNNFLESLCGIYSTEGEGDFQPNGEPVYQGNQFDWVFEQIDLSSFIGQEIRIRFLLESDNFVEFEGFYFDDMEIQATIDNSTSVETSISLEDFVQLSPNPGSSSLNISFTNKDPRDLKIYDSQGRLMFEKFEIQDGLAIDTGSWSRGIFYLQLSKSDGEIQMLKWIKQ